MDVEVRKGVLHVIVGRYVGSPTHVVEWKMGGHCAQRVMWVTKLLSEIAQTRVWYDAVDEGSEEELQRRFLAIQGGNKV